MSKQAMKALRDSTKRRATRVKGKDLLEEAQAGLHRLYTGEDRPRVKITKEGGNYTVKVVV